MLWLARFNATKGFAKVTGGCGQNPGPGLASPGSVMVLSQVFAYNPEDLILQATS